MVDKRNNISKFPSKLNVPFFIKNFICKHSIGIAVTMKLVQIPSDAKYDLNPIGCLPKRGRPPKAKRGQALCRFTH